MRPISTCVVALLLSLAAGALSAQLSISTPSPLPSGATGTNYSHDVMATGGTTPYAWQGTSPYMIVSGALPAGLFAIDFGSFLWLMGTPTGTGTATFTVEVHDNSGTPQVVTKQFDLTIVSPPPGLPFADDFSTNQGWQTQASWSRGVATAYSATGPNRTEPGTDQTATTTDNMILGDTIGGDYSSSMSSTEWATSPPINCANASGVRLSFWRWLGVSAGDTAMIQVSTNGSTWTDVWVSPTSTTINDTAWTSVYYDLTQVAAGYAVVQVRFGIGPTVGINVGWCIDDLIIEEAGPHLGVRERGSTGPYIIDDQAVGGGRDFGQLLAFQQQSPPLTIYLTNYGPTPITFGTIAKVGAQSTDFYLNAQSLTNPLPSGQSTSFTITFYRAIVGVSTATIQLPHNAALSGTSPFEINVRGEAIPTMRVNLGTVTGAVVSHQQSPVGTPRDFGSQGISAGPSASITIFITNPSFNPFNLSAPSVGGAASGEFTVNAAGMATNLAPSLSTSFTIEFDPSSVGVKDAYVVFAHTDGSQPSPFEIPVTGLGVVIPTEIRVTTQPAASVAGAMLAAAPVVAITDAVGNVDATDNSTQVQVAITASTGNPLALLSGTLTVTAVNGIVTFTDLQISHGGNGYTLTFTDATGPLGTVVSDPFDVTSPAGGGGGDEEESGCSTGTREGPALLLALLAVVGLLVRRREPAAASR